MVQHQAISADEPLVSFAGFCEQSKEVSVLARIGVEILTAHTAIHQVVASPGELNAWRARHGINLRAGANRPGPTGTFVAQQSLVRDGLGSGAHLRLSRDPLVGGEAGGYENSIWSFTSASCGTL